jgi:hypothetical protein
MGCIIYFLFLTFFWAHFSRWWSMTAKLILHVVYVCPYSFIANYIQSSTNTWWEKLCYPKSWCRTERKYCIHIDGFISGNPAVFVLHLICILTNIFSEMDLAMVIDSVATMRIVRLLLGYVFEGKKCNLC